MNELQEIDINSHFEAVDRMVNLINNRVETSDVADSNLPSAGEQMTEQAYLDLAQQMKEIVAEKEKECQKLKNELNDYKYVMYKVFGITSFLEDLLNGFDDFGTYGQTMGQNLEYINSQISMLLNIK